MKRVIIGGGMSGLVCAITSAKLGHETIVIERNSRLGKKISMTGNGKCNIANVNASIEHFNKSRIVDLVLDKISVADCLEFLKECGIHTFADEHGRVYPVTENANSVVDCLRYACDKHNVKVMLDTAVLSVLRNGKSFVVNTDNGEIIADDVVLACGSESQAATLNLTNIVPSNYFTKLTSGLVPVKMRDMDKQINGLRVKTNLMLMDAANNILAKSKGEVQFREFGLSGICVMDLSSYIARELITGSKREYYFSMDLLPHLTKEELYNELLSRKNNGMKGVQLFLGLLHNKFAEVVAARTTNLDLVAMVSVIKDFRYRFDKLLDYSLSQITVGGIDEKYVDDNLTLPNGIHAVGEILNVDGLCGGYNLYFATASALYLTKLL